MYYYWTKKAESEEYSYKLLPAMNEVVFVEVLKFSNNNTYCKLLEYDNTEGFIPNTELDRKVIDPSKQFEIGKTYPMIVMGIRNTNGLKTSVDLSYKKVQKDTRSDLLSKFTKLNKLYEIITEFSFFTNIPFDLAQKEILLHKLEMNSQQYLSDVETLYKQYLKNPDIFFSGVAENMKEKANEYVENMKNRLTITQMLVYQKFRLWVIQENSLAILKDVLSYQTDKCKIEYVSSPKYQLTITCETDEERQQILTDFLSYIEEKKILYKIKFELDESQVIKNQEFILHPLHMVKSETCENIGEIELEKMNETNLNLSEL